MSEPDPEQGKGARSTKTKRFWLGTSLVVLFVFGAGNIFLQLFIIPKFQQIYADALPGKQLPTITEFILTARMVLLFIAMGWPIAGALLVKLQKPYAILWINLGIIWTILQIGITVI